MSVSELQAEHALDAGTALGEAPCWDARGEELLFVDIEAGSVHGWRPRSGARWRVDAGQAASFVVPRASGGWVVGLADGIGVLARVDGPIEPLVPFLAERPELRMNDGACDAAGVLWAGSSSTRGEREHAALYRVDASRRVHTVFDRVTTSNGIGWSPDGTRMYYADTGSGRVDVIAGGLRAPFVVVPPERGRPDGLAVDAEGGVWVALWGGGAVERYAPSAELTARACVPAPLTTSCCFGGSGLETLFVTTAGSCGRGGGALYAVAPGVRGLPAHAYAG